ncbi:activating transcription factor 7-interacting protein 1-like isoform X1 [Brienomyrus brachyistius]|uniref:activating transcription factor 7-interacting protein 1-like isoform X1 n=1 Tax=Brienomyrus brachyistius TaxID=42636 RepID=UPI0020B1FB2A|nr:activating transcription factor 7-interacting protein 1-like isoform X1 [Brienomyrus brachyistius]XP_048847970.1 activating transcription factor 7-interacting protein 1-like isoform X1 [Brienomyrus brachyistius]XP_048847971.1 activating transcription factor 7-interacting protein 1-like isoform X1 [Brienomyrus brachyistius]XP_048847972.1 activating transcription factor 7-interacting protein 1-like isoform X1 [Brienomyrus brachyistius]XP_048847974.1 activating transcription factor 7-interactin
MNVAIAEEPQKKVFRARKTMKLSDRQQLESLHNIRSSPSNTPPPVNGKHSEGGQTEAENDKENREGVASGSDSSVSVALTSAPSPVAGAEGKTEDAEAETVGVGGKENNRSKDKSDTENEDNGSKTETSPPLADELEQAGSDAPLKISEDACGGAEGTAGGDTRLKPTGSMETDLNSGTPMQPQSPLAPGNITSSPSLSPSHAPESDQEVKEGFLVLSEEEESQGEKEDGDKGEQDEDKMEMDSKGVEGENSEVSAKSSLAPITASPLGERDGEESSGSARKRARSTESGGEQDGGGVAEESEEKKARVEGEELEAQLELKISGKPGSRQRLEKVVQHLVAEQLRVLQLTVFDRSLQELRERVDRIDCATKHQHSLNTLQAKIARLTKKFGAANQAKDSTSKSQEAAPPPAATATMATTPTSSTAPTCRTTVRMMLESQRGEQQNSVPGPVSYAGSPNQRKLLPTVTAPTSLVRGPGCSTTTASSTSAPSTSVTSAALPPAQNRPAPPPVPKPVPANPTMPSGIPSSTPQSVSLQPLLIQLPLAVSGSQAGSIPAGHSPGVELISMSTLSGANALGKAKTSTPGTTYILQKTTAAASSSSSGLSVTSSASLPQISVARAAIYSGGSGLIGVPSPGVSVSSARTPAQCAPVIGVTSASSLPPSSAPAATGGQTPGLAAAGPVSVAMMASKTDGQTTVRTADPATAKTPAQVPRASSSGAVIDLTEDDDDVQVTGVKRAPMQPGHPPMTSPAAHRAPGALPSLSGGAHSQQAVRSSPQGQNMVNGPQLTVHHRPQQESHSKKYTSATSGPASTCGASQSGIPVLPPPPSPPARLPPEASHTSLPQQPQLKLARVQSQNGIVLSWSVAEVDRSCAPVDSYHLYAYHQDGPASPASQWKKIGEVKALALPMACTLTQFVSGSKYYFAVRARDIYGRFGPFCEPQCTDVIAPSSSG